MTSVPPPFQVIVRETGSAERSSCIGDSKLFACVSAWFAVSPNNTGIDERTTSRGREAETGLDGGGPG